MISFDCVNLQELEQCLLQKEEELRLIQSKAAEMEEELRTVLQEKQVSRAFLHLLVSLGNVSVRG